MLSTFLNLYAAITLGPTDIGNSNVINDQKVAYEINLPVSAIPKRKNTTIIPIIDAEAAAVIDFDSGTVLFEKNSNEKLQIASITKLMTAIIALEQGTLDEQIIVSNKAALTEGSKIWLYSGETISLKNLLYAILIHSGNDAAIAIAEHIAEDNEVKTFVDKMNKKAKKLGLLSTHFENPIGFDSPQNYSTVYDIALLARYTYRNEFIRNAVSKNTMTISSVDGNLTHDLQSTNDLLNSFLNVLGLKTGHTEKAGLCFVSVIENDNQNKIIIVVLNSPERFNETKMLATWAFRSYIW